MIYFLTYPENPIPMIPIDRASRWLESEWPLTIFKDRYNGAYSGGNYLAFPEDPWSCPESCFSDDNTCREFWFENVDPVGVGDSTEAALNDLRDKMRKFVRTS